MAEPLRRWGIAVGRHLVWQAASGPLVVDECWLGTDLALYVRYAGRFGARFAGLHIDPTSGRPIDARVREHSAGSAAQQASNLYDGGLGGGAPATVEWTDEQGYGWWGDTPPAGWADAVNGARLDTFTDDRP